MLLMPVSIRTGIGGIVPFQFAGGQVALVCSTPDGIQEVGGDRCGTVATSSRTVKDEYQAARSIPSYRGWLRRVDRWNPSKGSSESGRAERRRLASIRTTLHPEAG